LFIDLSGLLLWLVALGRVTLSDRDPPETNWRGFSVLGLKRRKSRGPGGCAVWLACLYFFVPALSGVAAPDTLTNDLQLIPEDTSLWKESMLWDKDIVLRAGVGYKDNVLLAPNASQGSGFVASGLDLTLIRLPLDGWEVNFTIVGDDVRYFRNPGGLKGEDLFTSSVQVQKYLSARWRTGLEVRYSYIDQVLQELLMSGGVQAIEAKGNTLSTRPFVRRELSTNWWIQLEAPLERDWWQAPLDAYWKVGGQGIIGFSYGPHSQVSLSGGGFYIPHDEWLARDASGAEVPGRILAIQREVAELKWEHQWDARNRWSSITRIGFNRNRDNGGGFFNFYRYFASEELRFHTKDWEAKASVAWSYYDFPVQTIDTPPSPTLHLATVNAGLRLERRLYQSVRGFAAFEFEQTTSDDPASEYRYKIVTGGLSWEF